MSSRPGGLNNAEGSLVQVMFSGVYVFAVSQGCGCHGIGLPSALIGRDDGN